jgi:hypothetical protein
MKRILVVLRSESKTIISINLESNLNFVKIKQELITFMKAVSIFSIGTLKINLLTMLCREARIQRKINF